MFVHFMPFILYVCTALLLLGVIKDINNTLTMLHLFAFTSISTGMALDGLICADVPLRNYTLTHSLAQLSTF